MAGEIQLNSTTMATESSGSITAELDTIRPNTSNGSLTLQGDSSDAGVTGLTIDSSGTVNTTTAKVTNIQATSGQSLTIKDEDGNAAITIGTDNTAAGYLSLNFGSYHGDSGQAGSGTLTGNTLDDFEFGTFTPTFANFDTGNGSIFGIYRKIGDMVTIYCGFTLGSTSSFSDTMHTIGGLPFTAISPTGSATENNINCLMKDVSTSNYHGFARVQRGAATIAYPHTDSIESGSNLISSSTPFTWTTNDNMTVFGQYLAS